MLDNKDFNLGYKWQQDGDVLYLNHFWLNPDNRRDGHGSFIIETIVRMAYYEGAEVVEVSIGGGEASENWLRENGFHILDRRPYGDWNKVEGGYGVDAVRRV